MARRTYLLRAGRFRRPRRVSTSQGSNPRRRENAQHARQPFSLSSRRSKILFHHRQATRPGWPHARSQRPLDACHRRKTFRPRSRLRHSTEQGFKGNAHRKTDLPHRPLSRQRNCAKSHGLPLRQFHSRTALNRNYIDHVQITAAETVGVEHRGGFYETAGALRDMVPNHLFQLLTMTAMEPPISFDADEVRNKQAEVLHAIQPLSPEEVLTNMV